MGVVACTGTAYTPNESSFWFYGQTCGFRVTTCEAASKESNTSHDYGLSHRLLMHWFGITHLGSLKGRWYPIVHPSASSRSLPLLLWGIMLFLRLCQTSVVVATVMSQHVP